MARMAGRLASAAVAAERSADSGAGREALLQVAIGCFVEKGFHGTSMRDIAQRADASIAAIYYYFPSKSDILRHIMLEVTRDLLERLHAASAAAGPDPAAQLAAVVQAHVRLHTERQAESFIGNTELRSLASADRREVVALRDQVADAFRRPIAAGVKRGQFACAHPHEATLALLTMCTAVAGWYRPDGGETPQTLAERFAALALAMVGGTP